MELKVGMYVRLGRNQGIAKIDEYDEEHSIYILDKCIADEWGEETFELNKEDIIGEPSFNIIDLIEEGDYVNGYKVVNFECTYFNGVDRREEPKRIYVIVENGKFEYENWIKKDDIKSIVTKEQFESLKYKVSD